MKVKVITPFIDEKEKKTRVVDEIFEVSKERYAEIKKKGRLVVPVREKEPVEKKEPVKK